MASSSRLVGRLLGRPASFISYSSRSSVNSRSLYRAAFSTSAARADSSATTEEIKAEVIPDPAVLKRRKDIKGTSVKRKTTRRSTKTLSTEVSSKFAKAESEIFTPDVTGPFPHLPKEEDWDGAFNAASFWSIRHRQFIANPESIEKVVQSMELERRSKEAGRKLTILECYPGPGTITRRLMQDENVEKVVVMEDHKGFAPYLQALSTDPTLGDNAAKLHIITNDCFNWETYTEMIDSGALDHIPAVKEIKESKPVGPLQFGDDWKAASPILLLGQFPTTVQAEQLLAQFTAAISRRYWQFRYTRMPMFFVCSEHTAWRCIAYPGQRLRNRLSVVTQVLAEAEILLESEHLSPHEHHFWPYQHSAGGRLPRTQNPDISKENKTGSLLAYGQCLLKIEPRADVLLQPQEVEPFEYIVRNLFVKRASSIKSQLAHLAPGAVKLLDVMRDDHPALAALGPVDINPDTLICDMTHTQFIALSKIFERWPFKPRSYFETLKASAEELAELEDSFISPDEPEESPDI